MDTKQLESLEVVLEAARRHLEDAGMPMKQYGGIAYKIISKWLNKQQKNA